MSHTQRMRWLLAGLLYVWAASAWAQTKVPATLADSGADSSSGRFQWRERPDPSDWPERSSVVPAYEAWELSWSSWSGEGRRALGAGEQIERTGATLAGPSTVRTRSAADLISVAKVWAGHADRVELYSVVGLGFISASGVWDNGFNALSDRESAGGLLLAIGAQAPVLKETDRLSVFGRVGVLAGNPFVYLIGDQIGGGATAEAVFGELGVSFRLSRHLGLRAGVQSLQFIPAYADDTVQSRFEAQLAGPFFGLVLAL